MAVGGLYFPPLPHPLLFKVHACSGRACRIHPRTPSESPQSRHSLATLAMGGYSQTHIPLPEFIFAEIHGKQPISIFKAITAKVQQRSASWADLSSALRDLKKHRIPVSAARAALNLADSVNLYPLLSFGTDSPPNSWTSTEPRWLIPRTRTTGASLSRYDGIARRCLRMPRKSSRSRSSLCSMSRLLIRHKPQVPWDSISPSI